MVASARCQKSKAPEKHAMQRPNKNDARVQATGFLRCLRV